MTKKTKKQTTEKKNKDLTEAQKKFIEAKVKELGTFEEVYKFYKLQDDVTVYARDFADRTL